MEIVILEVTDIVHDHLVLGLQLIEKVIVLREVLDVLEKELGVALEQGVLDVEQVELLQVGVVNVLEGAGVGEDVALLVVAFLHGAELGVEVVQIGVHAVELGMVVIDRHLDPSTLDHFLELQGLLLPVDHEGDRGQLSVELPDNDVPPGDALPHIFYWIEGLLSVDGNLKDRLILLRLDVRILIQISA